MPRALIDTSTYLDILKAADNRSASWAENTAKHVLEYLGDHPMLTISAFTIFEVLDGIYRKRVHGAGEEFLNNILPSLDVIYPDQTVMALGAEINAALTLVGSTIGGVDSLIAATAIVHKLTLVNANTKHFQRVNAVGFPLMIQNWRL